MNHTISHLPILVINAHSRCNCRCTMCDIWKTTATQSVSPADLQAQLADIGRLGVENVVFSGGEPLMNPELFTLAEALHDRGIRNTLLSTGILLERHAEQIVKHIDEVIVSLDGPPEIHDKIRQVPGCFQAVRNGVTALRSRNPHFPLSVRSTLQRANHAHVAETIRTARELGADSISFLAVDVDSNAFGRDTLWPVDRRQSVQLRAEEVEALSEALERVIQHGDGFVRDSPQHLRRIVGHFRALLGLAEFEAPRCNAPWVSAVLEANGDLRPCFFHAPYGSAGKALGGQLNSPQSVEFRRTLDVATNPTCRRCVCSLYLPAKSLT